MGGCGVDFVRHAEAGFGRWEQWFLIVRTLLAVAATTAATAATAATAGFAFTLRLARTVGGAF